MMLNVSCKTLPMVMAFALAGAFAPGVARADAHLDEAINHAKNAIDNGMMGHARMVVAHAEAALSQARAAQLGGANEHTKAGIEHLSAAIVEGRENHAAEATKEAEEALAQLEEAAR
jgi:hypothetical protein